MLQSPNIAPRVEETFADNPSHPRLREYQRFRRLQMSAIFFSKEDLPRPVSSIVINASLLVSEPYLITVVILDKCVRYDLNSEHNRVFGKVVADVPYAIG